MPLDDYYRQLSKYETPTPVAADNPDFYELPLTFLKEHGVKKNDRILDLGCGAGTLLYHLKKAGFSNLMGMELNERNCSFIEDEYGIPVIRGGLGYDHSESDGKIFDVIILDGVIEHLLLLRRSMAECVKLLSKTGKILLVCPDVAVFPYFGDIYQQFSVEHINFFDTVSLKHLLEWENMKLVGYREIGVYASGKRSDSSMWLFGKEGEEISPDVTGMPLDAYLSRCAKQVKEIRTIYDRAVREGGFYLWGTGTFAAVLFQMGILKESDVLGTFDSNRNFHGRIAYGHTVQSPEVLKDMENRPILIATRLASDSIQAQIHKLGLKNQIITF